LLIFLTSKAFADPPTADAGPDQTVNEQTPVTLDGSGSSDPEDGPNVAFSWNQPVSLSDANTSSPTFKSPVVLVSQRVGDQVGNGRFGS